MKVKNNQKMGLGMMPSFMSVLGQSWAIMQSHYEDLVQQAFDGEEPTPAASIDIMRSAQFGAAVLPIKGVITPFPMWGESTSPANITAAAQELAADDTVSTVFLDMETPGGHTLGVKAAADALLHLASVKEVISYSGLLNASAGEYLSSAANKKYAAPGAIIGSVGVFAGIYDFSAMLEEHGVKLHLIRDGKYKGMGVFGKEVTDDELAHIEEGVMKTSREFKGFMRQQRPGIKAETMQGQTFEGSEGVENHLLDGVSASLPELIGSFYRQN